MRSVHLPEFGTHPQASRYAPYMTDDDPLAALRKRAYELADTARYSDWASLSSDLVDEGVPEVIVRRLTHDALFQTMLNNRMRSARERDV